MIIKPIVLSGLSMVFFALFMLVFSAIIPLEGVWKMATYQGGILIVSLISLGILALRRKKPLVFLRKGEIAAPGDRMRLLLVKQGTSWTNTGLSLTVVISLVLGVFMFGNAPQNGAEFSPRALLQHLPIILAFSISNAWSEELFFRLIPGEIVAGTPGEGYFPLLSAIVFGAAHWWGSPGGPVGIIMSGFLGYALARSVVETRGMFWAFLIHFIQDLIIFSALFGFDLVA